MHAPRKSTAPIKTCQRDETSTEPTAEALNEGFHQSKNLKTGEEVMSALTAPIKAFGKWPSEIEMLLETPPTLIKLRHPSKKRIKESGTGTTHISLHGTDEDDISRTHCTVKNDNALLLKPYH